MMHTERLPDYEDLENEALNWLDGENPTTPEYSSAVNNLEKLHKLALDSHPVKRMLPSPDNLFRGAVYLLGLALVLNYEQLHVVSSKAFGMLGKP